MNSSTKQQSPISPEASSPKRPRLSLQTPGVATTSAGGVGNRRVGSDSTTAFNTLSDAYAAAILSASPKTVTQQSYNDKLSMQSRLRLVTNVDAEKTLVFPSQHTPAPGAYPDTPTLYSATSPLSRHPLLHSSTFTFTPPQSAQPADEGATSPFPFPLQSIEQAAPLPPRTLRRRTTTGGFGFPAPYTHPRSLRSILRNSPLPPRSAATPLTPTRASQRLAERRARKLAFHSPLTQTITTSTYVKSHIELLADDASPFSPTSPSNESTGSLDLTMAYDGHETRDGGQTPGPFEEMRRRMAGLGSESDPETPLRKRKRREKKRRWVWTIGVNEEESPVMATDRTPSTAVRNGSTVETPLTAIRRLSVETPVTAIQRYTPEPERWARLAAIAEQVTPTFPPNDVEKPDEPLDTAIQTDIVTTEEDAPSSAVLPTFRESTEEDETMLDRPSTSHSI